MTEQTKTCTGPCEETKEVGEFRQRRLKSGNGMYRIGICRQCERDEAKIYRENNPETVKFALQKWKRENKKANRKHSNESYYRCLCARAQNSKEWRERNPDKVLESNRRQVSELTDSYVRNELRKEISAEPPQELVAMKREQIEFIRLRRQLKRTYKEIFK